MTEIDKEYGETLEWVDISIRDDVDPEKEDTKIFDLFVRGIHVGTVVRYKLGSYEGGYQWWTEWSERFTNPKYPNVTAKSAYQLSRKIKERFGI